MQENHKETVRYAKELVQTELAISYRYPTIILLFAVFLIVTGFTVRMVAFRGLRPSFYLDEPFNSTEELQHWSELIASRAGRAHAFSLEACLIILSFLIPLLVSFTFSRYFENGTFRTLLSFPIGRSRYLVAKSGVLIALSFLFPLVTTLLWINIWYPPFIGIEYFAIMSMSALASVFVITSTSILISIVSRNSFATAIGGLSLWGGVLYVKTNRGLLENSPQIVHMIRRFLDPLGFANFTFYNWMSDFTFGDILVSVGLSFGLSVMLLVVAIIIFKNVEV